MRRSISLPGIVGAYALVACLAAGTARAAQDEEPAGAEELLKKAATAYDEMEYDKAMTHLRAAEKYPASDDSVRIDILKYRALIYIIEGKEILARDDVNGIYDLNPSFDLPPTVSPKFRKFFADVKAERQRERGRPAPPTVARPPQIERPGPGAPEKPNAFVRFWPSWLCLAAGAGMLVPGILVGLDVTSGKDQLAAATRDQAGRIISMTQEQAQALQDDADKKGLTADILIGAGAAALATGIVMFFVYDGARETGATPSTSVTFSSTGGGTVAVGTWRF